MKMKDNNKFKKKKKKNNRGTLLSNPPIYTIINSTTSANGGTVFDENLIRTEILTRLPVKSLVRFKSVSTRWNSIIEKDQNFIDLHLTRSKSRNPCLLIITLPPKEKNPTYREMMFLTANMIESRREEGRRTRGYVKYNYSKNPLTFNYDQVTNSINGLICFMDTWVRHDITPYLYNISTQEVTPLVKSTLLEEERAKYGSEISISDSIYQFGFDPASNEYKLVCLSLVYKSHMENSYNCCEVLTVGGARARDANNKLNNRWRKVDNNIIPPYLVDDSCLSIYVNGSIYWTTCGLSYGVRYIGKDYGSAYIVAFDVGSETFKTIQIPGFIFDHPIHRENATSTEFRLPPDPQLNLLEIDGRVALQIKISDYVIKLWVLDEEKKENTTTSSNQNWRELTMTLPFCWGEHRSVRLHTIPNHIILQTHHIRDIDMKEYAVTLYSYDWKKDIFTEFEIKQIPWNTNFCSFSLRLFVESLLPVPKLSGVALSN